MPYALQQTLHSVIYPIGSPLTNCSPTQENSLPPCCSTEGEEEEVLEGRAVLNTIPFPPVLIAASAILFIVYYPRIVRLNSGMGVDTLDSVRG